MTIHATILHFIKNDKILLQKKAKGYFGEGKWNGVGGRIEKGETPIQAAKREAIEESGLKPINPSCHGVLTFYFGKKDTPFMIVHIYATKKWTGSVTSSDEGELKWFKISDIPYEDMWQDDKFWLPLLLQGKKFSGEFYFNEDGTKLNDYILNVKE